MGEPLYAIAKGKFFRPCIVLRRADHVDPNAVTWKQRQQPSFRVEAVISLGGHTTTC
jgi:hypothetical protein